MKNVLVRDIPERVLDELKKHAEKHGRSLQAEIRLILEDSATQFRAMELFREQAEKVRASLGKRKFSDSAKLIRRDRDRR